MTEIKDKKKKKKHDKRKVFYLYDESFLDSKHLMMYDDFTEPIREFEEEMLKCRSKNQTIWSVE